MKIFLLLTLSVSVLLASNYTYLVNTYSKETELEAQIIVKMARDILRQDVIKLYIPGIKELDRQVYSKKTILVQECETANFVFEKYEEDSGCSTQKDTPYVLTSNYKQLLDDKSYFGAFFWSKSRPNIVFVGKRLRKYNIKLSKEYRQFIEEDMR